MLVEFVFDEFVVIEMFVDVVLCLVVCDVFDEYVVFVGFECFELCDVVVV